jgi:N utilization substance protein A
MKSDFLLAFNEIAEVRKLPREIILDALQAALVSAYRRNAGIGTGQRVEARIDDQAGMLSIWAEKEVVDEVANEHTEVALPDARAVEPGANLGDMVMMESTPQDFGRIAAQTAKQVILQRMREAERETQYQEYLERVGDLVTGTVQSDSNGVVTLGLGRTEAILPRSQQMPGERYRIHEKVRAYVMDVHKSNRGPQIVVSRTHRNMLRRLLEYEVPEIYNGTVEIKSIAREPGARSKVAVAALQEGADPVGACVGMRGVRIQSIVKELNNEKIDVIEWNSDPKYFIAKALSPARVSSVFLDDDPESGRTAIVVVPEDQLSLAIGREGQNARLGAKLTGWRIDIKSITEAAQEALNHLEESTLVDLAQSLAEVVAAVNQILEKKATNRPIQPEEYQALVEFINKVEVRRFELRESGRSEKRERRIEARAKVPPLAFQHSLEDTDLPHRIYNSIAEAGYQTVGEVMEQYFLEPKALLNLPGVGAAGLEAIESMLKSIDFSAPAVEAADADAQGLLTTQPEQVSVDAVDTQASEPAETAVEGEAKDEEYAREQRAALIAQMTTGAATQGIPLETGEAPVTEPGETSDQFDEFGEVEDPTEYEGLSTAEVEEVKREKAKQRRRQLVFDEDLGRMVSKRRRKPGRTRGTWDDFFEEEEEE